MLSCVETWHAGLSLPAQTLLPNLKIKCLQWQQKRVQRVCPKHAKSKERCLHFKVHAHVNTYNIQTTVCDQWFDRKMDNFEGDTKPVLIILTEKKAYLNPSLPSIQQLSPPGHAMSSTELQSGTLLALTKEDVSLHSRRICPLTKGVTIFTERGRGRRREEGRE